MAASRTTPTMVKVVITALCLVGAAWALGSIFVRSKPEFLGKSVNNVKFVHESPFTRSGFRDRYVYEFKDARSIEQVRTLTNSLALTRKRRAAPSKCIASDKYGLQFTYRGAKAREKFDPILRCNDSLYGNLTGADLDEYLTKLEDLGEKGGYRTTDQRSAKGDDSSALDTSSNTSTTASSTTSTTTATGSATTAP